MIPSILLALTVIVVMIDVLVGIHRGFGYSVVRLLIWIAGSFICALFARSFTVWLLLKMAKVPDMKAFALDTFGSMLTDTTGAVGTHLTGTFISFMIPVVFVGMFIASKFITWIIYCIVKQLIKKAAKRAEAHNAAVDAVKAIQSSEMPDAEAVEQQPIPQPSFGSPDQSSDFGTFGIYPKEDESTEDDDEEEQVVEVVDAAVVNDGFEMVAEATEAVTEATEEDTAVVDSSDGFEVIAASSEDGFESLAREQKFEEKKEVKPVKEKKLKKKHSLSMLIIKKSVFSSVLGGILGAFISLYACAIMFSPISEMVKIISEKRSGEPLVELVTTVTGTDMETLIKNGFRKDAQPITGIDRDFEITSDISIRPEDFAEAIDDHEDTVIYYIYKYSGASGAASFIYNKLTPVNVKATGLDNLGITIYNFPDTLRSYLSLLDPANNLIDYMCSGKGFDIEMLDKLESFFGALLQEKVKGEILTSADKTAIVNSLVIKLNDKIEEIQYNNTIPVNIEPIQQFEDIDDARTGLSNIFERMRMLIRAGLLDY
ncbi:MAG: hypothetical protein IKW90_03160 [Lachnospiraceae bacterium]|nr:hypothetical protein [Lachnospiraceae bacterium]